MLAALLTLKYSFAVNPSGSQTAMTTQFVRGGRNLLFSSQFPHRYKSILAVEKVLLLLSHFMHDKILLDDIA